MLNGCGVRGINRIPPTFVTQYGTYYSKSLDCLGGLLDPANSFKYVTMIASFLDKTGKGSITTSKPITQGAADLAADSIAKMKYFKIKTAIPHNFRDNPQIFEFNKNGTDFFVHGSIVTLESTQDQRNLSFNLDPINLTHKVTRVLAIVHMSINSSLDNTVFVNERGEMASGNFKAEWDIFENEYGFFRLVGDSAVVLNGAIKMSQVADQALHEAIELGLIELFGKMFQVPYERCLPKKGADFSEIDEILQERAAKRDGKETAAQRKAAPQSPSKTKKSKANKTENPQVTQPDSTAVTEQITPAEAAATQQASAEPPVDLAAESAPAAVEQVAAVEKTDKPKAPKQKTKHKPKKAEPVKSEVPPIAESIGEVKPVENTTAQVNAPVPPQPAEAPAAQQSAAQKPAETPAAVSAVAPDDNPNRVRVAKMMSQEEAQHLIAPKQKRKPTQKTKKTTPSHQIAENKKPDQKPDEKQDNDSEVNPEQKPALPENVQPVVSQPVHEVQPSEAKPIAETPNSQQIGASDIARGIAMAMLKQQQTPFDIRNWAQYASMRPSEEPLDGLTSDAEPAVMAVPVKASTKDESPKPDVALVPLGKDENHTPKTDPQIITKTVFDAKAVAKKTVPDQDKTKPKLALGEIAAPKTPVAKQTEEKEAPEAKETETKETAAAPEPENKMDDAAAMDAKQLTPMHHNMKEPAAPETPKVEKTPDAKKVPVAKKTTETAVAKDTTEPEAPKEEQAKTEEPVTSDTEKEKPAAVETEKKKKTPVAKATGQKTKIKKPASAKAAVAEKTNKEKPETLAVDAPLTSLQDVTSELTPLTPHGKNNYHH